MIKAILMDFNGVIIDDEPVHMRAYQEVLAAEGVELTEEDYLASLGMDDVSFVRAAYSRKGKSVEGETKIADLIDAKTSKWREVVTAEMPLFEGIENFIEKMSREFSLGIVSMARRSEIDHVLTRTGLGKFFSSVISGSDVNSCKPDPECYRIGFRQLDAARVAAGHLPMTHSECLAIEDSPPGIMAARAADLPALGVANTVVPDRLREAGAGAIAYDLRDWMPESIRLVFA
jgi:beta-phosphoglucomutase